MRLLGRMAYSADALTGVAPGSWTALFDAAARGRREATAELLRAAAAPAFPNSRETGDQDD
jgi:hypothetical protein